MSQNKILIFTDCYIYGGSERLMSFLIKNEIINKNFHVSLAYRNHPLYKEDMQMDYQSIDRNLLLPLNLLSNETLFYKINCKQIPLILKKVIKIPFYIIEKLNIYTVWNLIVFLFFLRKNRPHLIHINNGGYPGAKSCNTLVWANHLFLNAKVIYQVNNQAMDPKPWDYFFDKSIGRYVDKFLTASNLAKDRLVTARKFDKDKIEVINNCVVPLPVKLGRLDICKELNLSEKSFIITQVAFLSKRKGQAYLIKAISQLFIKQKDLKEHINLIFIGNGEDERMLKELVKQKDLENNVIFLGYKSNSEDYIAATDLFVLPSISNEDMPLAILTALQLGKPIIATNCAGIAQVIQSGVNGILVDCKLQTLSNDLCASIENVYLNSILRKQLSVAAEQSFLEYTPDKYGKKISNTYFEILNNER